MADAETDGDSRVVFTAESAAVAAAVVQLLAANDIPAEVAEAPRQEASALTGAAGTPADEFPVVVTDASKLTAARDLLATAQTVAAVKAVRDRRANRTGTIAATCEDCGKSSDWSAQAMGTTEVCPHCGGYMDIPDPDDDWSGVDFGTDDDEIEPKEE